MNKKELAELEKELGMTRAEALAILNEKVERARAQIARGECVTLEQLWDNMEKRKLELRKEKECVAHSKFWRKSCR